jgi:sugar phosphate isomerase/epimerase
MILAPWTQALQVAAENEFDAFEIDVAFPSADLDSITPDDIRHARRIAEEAEMEICVHAPFFELNIAAYCRGIRDESVRYIQKSVDLCADLGGEVLVVHSGKYTYAVRPGETRANNMGMHVQWKNNIDSLKRITEYAASRGVIVCLENLAFSAIDRTFEDLLEIRDAVGEELQFTLDIGHARLKTPGGVKEGLRVLGEHIRHIHFTDNNGEYDDHLPIGDGNFDYSEFFDVIRAFPHIVILEVVDIGTDPAAILKSREYFRSLQESL